MEKKKLYLFTNVPDVDWGGGMVLVAAPNAFKAMEILKADSSYIYHDYSLEHVVGAVYEGKEGIIKESIYIE